MINQNDMLFRYPGMLGGKFGILGNTPLHGKRGRRVELAIDQRMQQQVHIRGVGRQSVTLAHCLAPSSDISSPRARDSRDMTVPIGTPRMAAMSR